MKEEGHEIPLRCSKCPQLISQLNACPLYIFLPQVELLERGIDATALIFDYILLGSSLLPFFAFLIIVIGFLLHRTTRLACLLSLYIFSFVIFSNVGKAFKEKRPEGKGG